MLLKVGSPYELSAALLSELQAYDISTVDGLFAADAPTLIEHIPQFRRDASLLNRLLNKLYTKVVLPSRTLAETYTRLLSSHSVFSTGDSVLDTILSGGLFTGDHVEVCGPQGIRTLFCHRVAAHLLKNDSHASVLYVDSACNFRPELFVEHFGCSSDLLKRVQVLHTHQLSQLLRFLDHLQQGKLKSQKETDSGASTSASSLWPRLIIIDSMSELVNPLLLCNEDLVCVLGLLNHVGITLRSVATHQRLVVLTTNDFANGEPALGKMWTGSPHVRLLINENSTSLINAQTVTVLKSVREIKF
ncbi:DNA repair protein RAD51 homolog 4-like [Varroa jacobsoni]|uniref:DNA repair protein RAD51 homolog 4-like n=1 Tax=Varroa jacobsoni TaxID=62625 RepID=UPI000BF6B575|nr:DNA repair protein RAD51 homolog 4-like [Varroa jacobsoni]XP_022700129.1 DNA repair protein RAD51 homolog 4-like [Varroa jacobsoni]